MINFLKQNKIFSILIILSIIALIAGVIFYAKLDSNSREIVANNINNLFNNSQSKILTYIGNHLLSITIIWILGISIIGLPFILIIYLYLLFICSFELCALFSCLGLKSIIPILLYIIPKLLMITIIFILCYYAIHFSIYLFKNLFMHKNITLLRIMKRYKMIYLYTLIGLGISSILEYINMNYLLKIFK